jgi:hypothetical protein
MLAPVTAGRPPVSASRGVLRPGVGRHHPKQRLRPRRCADLAGPHLPGDLLGQALAAATAISDDPARAQALAGLAPHLPADLLGQALTAASEGSTEPLVALLERVTQLSPTISHELLLGLLRSCLEGIERASAVPVCLPCLLPHRSLRESVVQMASLSVLEQ